MGKSAGVGSAPPLRVHVAPGTRASDEQTVEIDFLVEADGTRVNITHRGWHAAGEETCALAAAGSWPLVLKTCFVQFVADQVLVAV